MSRKRQFSKNNNLSFEKKRFKRKDGLNFNRQRKKLNVALIKYIAILVFELGVMIGLGYLVVDCFGKQVELSNSSMEPTYLSGDIVLVNRFAYSKNMPKPNDIIAFKPKSNVNASYSIKRVIAGPGDTVLIEKGKLIVNGEKWKDSFSSEKIEIAGTASTEITLLDDQYFVLGDNRNSSEDSRYESIGFVSTNDILGRVWVKFPFK